MGYLEDLQNVGVLSGGAQGFIKGMQDAEESSMRKEDREYRRLEMDAKFKSQDQERQRQREQDERKAREDAVQARARGLMAPPGEDIRTADPNTLQWDPQYLQMQQQKAMAGASADPFGAKQAQATNAKLEIQKKMQEANQAQKGFKLPPDKVLQIQQGAQIPTQLTDIEGTLKQNDQMFGPMQGRMASMNPYNEQAQTVDAQLRAASQNFGRYMEGGVLRKEDEDKYRKMFPQLTDTPQVALNKLAVVRKLLVDKQNADTTALGAQGYDTTGFSQLESAQLPKGLGKVKAKGKLNTGMIDAGQAQPSGPKRGDVVDGYEFMGGDPADQKNWKKK